MNTNQSTRESFKMKHSSKPSVEKPKFINTDYLMEISSGDGEFIAVFLKAFQEESKRSLRSLQNQLSKGDFVFMEKTAHAMKPTGAYIGANSLSILAAQLEQAARNFNQTEARTLISRIQNMVESILKEIEEYFSK